MLHMLESGKSSDFTLVIGDTNFAVHKLLLSTHSPVFAAMFEYDDTREMQKGRVEISDIEPEVMKAMLKNIYSGKIEVLHHCAIELMVAADKVFLVSFYLFDLF